MRGGYNQGSRRQLGGVQETGEKGFARVEQEELHCESYCAHDMAIEGQTLRYLTIISGAGWLPRNINSIRSITSGKSAALAARLERVL